MEVPSDVLRKLVCERCSGYLSRGPVHLVENNKYRCGRCPWTEGDGEEGIRVEAYEELAELMTFPCRYRENGCASKVTFADNKRHELTCPYRECPCPFAESDLCEWTGLLTGILEHCQQDHATKVVQNPYKFKYDITQPNLMNYIVFAFEVIFLIHIRVCTAVDKIYHTVRLIGDPTLASNFKYSFELRNIRLSLGSGGDVLPRELLVLQEDTCEELHEYTLLETLTEYDGATLTVTIQPSCRGICQSDTLGKCYPGLEKQVQVICGKCRTGTEPVYRGDWLCHEHAPEQLLCCNRAKGCSFFGFDSERRAHEVAYCNLSQCYLCREDMADSADTMAIHYSRVHGDITHKVGTVFTIRPGVKDFLIECEFGKTAAGYKLGPTSFVLNVHTPLRGAELYMYRCTVELSHPDTGRPFTRAPLELYVTRRDWYIQVALCHFTAYVHDTAVNMRVNIIRINDLSQFTV